MYAPFILERIKLPERKKKKDLKDRCYFCDRKIKEEKGYYTFHRKWDDESHSLRYVCHRDNCQSTFAPRISEYKYKNINRHAAYDYFYF